MLVRAQTLGTRSLGLTALERVTRVGNEQLIITNTWFLHKLLHQAKRFRNDNCSGTGHMIDYILVNKNHMSSSFVCTGRLFTSPTMNLSCLLCTSKSRPSIDTQRHHATKPPTSPLLTRLATSQLVLAEAYDKFDQTSAMNAHWDSFKSSIQKACESRPPAPRISDSDWITDEVRNLSRKKKEAWVHLRNAPPQDISRLKTEYNHLKKLTKVSAEKARNSWWSESAAEAECH